MSYFVYMLKSKGSKPVTYVGYTSDLGRRSPYNIGRALNLREEENGN